MGSFRVVEWGGWLDLREEFGTVGYEFTIKPMSGGSSPDTICIQKPSKQDSKNLAAQPPPPLLEEKKQDIPDMNFAEPLPSFQPTASFPRSVTICEAMYIYVYLGICVEYIRLHICGYTRICVYVYA